MIKKTRYQPLLETFNTISGGVEEDNYDEIACAWLNKERMVSTKEGRMIKKTRYQQMVENLPLQGKPELYIGGIFPITGNKYKAPELAKVAQMAVEDVNADNEILSNYKLVLSIGDGKCEADVVMKKFIDIIKTK